MLEAAGAETGGALHVAFTGADTCQPSDGGAPFGASLPMQDTRYGWAYLFGAVCPERAVGAGLVLPRANTEALNLHLVEISKAVAPGAHAALVLDGAGWPVGDKLSVPNNISLVELPPYAPELNPIENVWAYLRGTKLATACSTATRIS